jgi:phosphatidylglycerophosphate synthase
MTPSPIGPVKFPDRKFPMIRWVSALVTPLLAATPLTANQVTAVSLLFGLASIGAFMQGGWPWTAGGAVLLFVSYVLDNCDGELARLKDQCSEFGDRFDTFVDWVVNASFFAALGIGATAGSGEAHWMWLGWAAAGGATLNYFIGLYLESRQGASEAVDETPDKEPETRKEWVIFFFRELARADFCFIVLALAALDLTWVLLPTGAVGAQVYWATQFIRSVRGYHV